MSQERILITGGLGFIGTNLYYYLKNKGYLISIIDNWSITTGNNAFNPFNKIDDADIRDEDIGYYMQNHDIVVHLAAFTRVLDSFKNPQECFSVNIDGTLNLLRAAKQAGIKKFIFASSNAVMGNQEPPFNENMQPSPISPMGLSKLIGESLCRTFYEAYGLNTVVLRFSNCYGKYSRHKTSVIHKFIRKLMHDEPLVINGDGNQSRDFVYAEDICRGIEACFHSNGCGEVFHLGSGVETSINQLAEIMMNVSGNKTWIEHNPVNEGEILRNYSDITKAQMHLNYKPQVSLLDGIRETWKWYKG